MVQAQSRPGWKPRPAPHCRTHTDDARRATPSRALDRASARQELTLIGEAAVLESRSRAPAVEQRGELRRPPLLQRHSVRTDKRTCSRLLNGSEFPSSRSTSEMAALLSPCPASQLASTASATTESAAANPRWNRAPASARLRELVGEWVPKQFLRASITHQPPHRSRLHRPSQIDELLPRRVFRKGQQVEQVDPEPVRQQRQRGQRGQHEPAFDTAEVPLRPQAELAPP